MRKSVAVDELDGPVEDADQTLQDAKENVTDNVPVSAGLALCDGADLSEAVNDGDNETSKADAAEGVGHGTTESPSGCSFREVLAAKVPGAIDAGDCDVDDVLDDLGGVICGKSDKHNEPDDFTVAATACSLVAGWVVAWLIFDVDGDKSNRIPRGKGGGNESADKTHNVDCESSGPRTWETDEITNHVRTSSRRRRRSEASTPRRVSS